MPAAAPMPLSRSRAGPVVPAPTQDASSVSSPCRPATSTTTNRTHTPRTISHGTCTVRSVPRLRTPQRRTTSTAAAPATDGRGDPADERRAERDAHRGRDQQQHAVVRLGWGVQRVPPAQGRGGAARRGRRRCASDRGQRPARAPAAGSPTCRRPSSAKWCSASRLVRLETGSSSEAVLASHSVVMANGTRRGRAAAATAMTTGVSRTAVVSRLSTTVQARRAAPAAATAAACGAGRAGRPSGRRRRTPLRCRRSRRRW